MWVHSIIIDFHFFFFDNLIVGDQGFEPRLLIEEIINCQLSYKVVGRDFLFMLPNILYFSHIDMKENAGFSCCYVELIYGTASS